jgi:hypothetical protein
MDRCKDNIKMYLKKSCKFVNWVHPTRGAAALRCLAVVNAVTSLQFP